MKNSDFIMPGNKDENRSCNRSIQNETEIRNLKVSMNELKEDIKEMKDKLLARPTWIITIALTSMATICCSLIVYIVTTKNTGA